jgi:hypothetical protein
MKSSEFNGVVAAVGAGLTHHSELSESIYLEGEVYVDHRTGAEVELAGLKELGSSSRGRSEVS